MTDYPDWQRAFRIVGVDVTIPINIAAAAVTLNVAIASSAITLNVNIAAAAVDLNIVFTDQSVAVFDASAWFARQAQQIFYTGTAGIPDNSYGQVASSSVPAGYNWFITGMSWSLFANQAPQAVVAYLQKDIPILIRAGSHRGDSMIFDTPIRIPGGSFVKLYVGIFGAGATTTCAATFWGYQVAV